MIVILFSFQSAAVRNEPSFGGRGTRTVQQGQQPFFAPAVNITPGKVAEGKMEIFLNRLHFVRFHRMP